MRNPCAALLLLSLTGCAPKPEPPIQAVATLGEVMHDIVIPNAEVVWDAVGTIYTLEGVEEIQPKTTEEWMAVERSATTLMEAGNLLMMEPRAKDNKNWMQRAAALRAAGDAVRKAARERNPEAVFNRGGQLFEACQGCHFEYRFEEDRTTIRTH
ncbi:MAG: hypothetical protein FJW20_15285 [Acidimicrobiia bacterium]|nr:hypothetical protein [Acidimicrobiia bacterium]